MIAMTAKHLQPLPFALLIVLTLCVVLVGGNHATIPALSLPVDWAAVGEHEWQVARFRAEDAKSGNTTDEDERTVEYERGGRAVAAYVEDCTLVRAHADKCSIPCSGERDCVAKNGSRDNY